MTNKAGHPKSSQRTVRVFISSTFRDMQEEREELVKQVFPELRKRCRERGVEFTDVDLRWGVTEERSQRGAVLPICLAEIEKCRPYFICHLGNRYGWVPGEFDPELIKEQSWLKAHQQKSVTELEILHGVLENPKMEKRAFFYFRDPAVSEQIEQQLIKESDYRSEPPESKDKLAALKKAICDSGYAQQEYPNAQSFGARVLEDLWSAIDREYPEGTKPSPLERERMDHEAFAEARRKTYIGRVAYDQRLNNHVAGAGEPLVLLGESGAGKSALIANWMEKHREAYPDDFLITRFIGGTPNSADYVTLLRSIMMEIKARYEPEATNESNEDQFTTRQLSGGDKEDDIPSDPEKVKEAFPGWLARAAAMEAKTGSRFILILDGLNQLNDRDNAPDMGWLQCVINPHVRLILSTLPGRSLDALQKCGWPTIGIEPLEIPERDTFIIDYLARFGKELSDARRKRITQAQQSANPLYLRTLLEELRIFGIHEKLDDKIGHYLEAGTVEALFTKVLERYEQDYEREADDTTGLTREAMSLIWAARNGLSEEELLELLGTGDQLLPQAVWSPLYLAAEESLVNRSGLLSFFHDFMRCAVESRYLGTEEEKQKTHLRIADFFDRPGSDDRKVDELPWQLNKAQAWVRLKDCIAEPAMFLKLFTENKKYELTDYWLAIGERYDMVESYQAAIQRREADYEAKGELAMLLNQAAQFLGLNARYDGAEPFCRRALTIAEAAYGSDHPTVAIGLNNLAELLDATNRHTEAESLYRRALKIDEIVYGPDHPGVARALNNLAGLLTATNRHTEAEPLYRRALTITEAAYGPDHSDVARVLNNLAGLLTATNRHTEAEPLCRRALTIQVAAYGPDHSDVARVLNNLTWLLDTTNRHTEAEPFCRRALTIDEAVYGLDHPHVANDLSSLALLLNDTNRHTEAEPLYRRALTIREAAYGPDHPAVAIGLNNLAALLDATNRQTEAEPLCRRALTITEAAYGPDHPHVAIGLYNLAGLLKATDRQTEAEPLCRRALTITEAAYGPDHPNVANDLNRLALLLNDTNRPAEAEPLYRRALSIDEATYGSDHPDVARDLYNLGRLLFRSGDSKSARESIERAHSICRTSLGDEHPNTQAMAATIKQIRWRKYLPRLFRQ